MYLLPAIMHDPQTSQNSQIRNLVHIYWAIQDSNRTHMLLQYIYPGNQNNKLGFVVKFPTVKQTKINEEV